MENIIFVENVSYEMYSIIDAYHSDIKLQDIKAIGIIKEFEIKVIQ